MLTLLLVGLVACLLGLLLHKRERRWEHERQTKDVGRTFFCWKNLNLLNLSVLLSFVNRELVIQKVAGCCRRGNQVSYKYSKVGWANEWINIVFVQTLVLQVMAGKHIFQANLCLLKDAASDAVEHIASCYSLTLCITSSNHGPDVKKWKEQFHSSYTDSKFFNVQLQTSVITLDRWAATFPSKFETQRCLATRAGPNGSKHRHLSRKLTSKSVFKCFFFFFFVCGVFFEEEDEVASYAPIKKQKTRIKSEKKSSSMAFN